MKILFLSLLASLPSIYAVLFTPALPLIATHFEFSESEAQMAMTCFLCGYALGQLPYGPLANRFGRKPVLCIGIGIAILSCMLSILALESEQWGLFLVSRFLMAVGATVGLNIAYTIIGDLYEEQEAAKVLSFTMLISAIIPGIAIFVGATLVQIFSFHSCFYFLAVFGLFVLWGTRFLHETKPDIDTYALNIRQIWNKYREESQNSPLIFAGCITGCGAGLVYLFAAIGPFIAINSIGLTFEEYGRLSLMPSLGLLTGSLVTRKYVSSISLEQLLRFGIGILFVCSISMFALFSFDCITIYSLFIPMFFIDAALALIFTITAAIALNRAKDKSIGSSLLSFINLSICVVYVFLSSFFSVNLPISFLLLTILIFILMKKLIVSNRSHCYIRSYHDV